MCLVNYDEKVEEKPDVTYSDVGGCKEQIEKLKEVVETPLLNVSLLTASSSVAIAINFFLFSSLHSQRNMLTLVLIHLKVCYCLAHQGLGRLYVLELLPTEQMPVLSE